MSETKYENVKIFWNDVIKNEEKYIKKIKSLCLDRIIYFYTIGEQKELNNSLIYNDANNFTFISYNKKIWNLFIKKCKKNNLSETTIKNYTKCFKLFCSYLSENFIDNPTEETIYEYRDYLISNGKKPTTVKLYLASLKCLQQCSQERYRPFLSFLYSL